MIKKTREKERRERIMISNYPSNYFSMRHNNNNNARETTAGNHFTDEIIIVI